MRQLKSKYNEALRIAHKNKMYFDEFILINHNMI